MSITRDAAQGEDTLDLFLILGIAALCIFAGSSIVSGLQQLGAYLKTLFPNAAPVQTSVTGQLAPPGGSFPSGNQGTQVIVDNSGAPHELGANEYAIWSAAGSPKDANGAPIYPPPGYNGGAGGTGMPVGGYGGTF